MHGYRHRPPYYKPPKDTCDICGRSLYLEPRYRVEIYLRSGAYREAPYKTLIVCQDCLKRLQREIRENPRIKRLFKLRYRKMRTLGARQRLNT